MFRPSPVFPDKTHNRGGFTLIELLIVISIIGIIAMIAIPVFLGQRTKAARSEAMSNLEALRLLQEQFYAENDDYVPAAGTLGVCGKDNSGNVALIRAQLPGFKPGAGTDLFFSYCIEADLDINDNNTLGAVPPYQCFKARAFGNTGTPVDNYELNVDCNNEKNF